MSTSTKAIVQAVGAVLTAVIPLLTIPGHFGFSEIVNVIVVAVGAFVVWNTKNYPAWRYGKLLASIATTLTTGLVALASNYAFGDVSTQQWVQLLIALLTTAAVGYLPNARGDSTDPTPRSGTAVL
jgi:hypothetical protein